MQRRVLSGVPVRCNLSFRATVVHEALPMPVLQVTRIVPPPAEGFMDSMHVDDLSSIRPAAAWRARGASARCKVASRSGGEDPALAEEFLRPSGDL